MAKKIVMEVTMKGKGIKSTSKNVEKTRKETDKLDRSRQRLGKSTDRYSRREKGVAQLGMNTTKSFSKMQQGIGGEGGAGGLVRAYALLAANVFALSAAFGILSRSAQVDTLIESMERLELVTGNAVKGIARELQAAASGGLDIAESMRSTSLALSAGFDTSTIIELGEVAKNAAVSLGRPIADSLDRIFRGVIKVEPELLDEIGLFVRVREAAARYASTLGIAASSLTEFQKRQAFAIESIRQGREKFEEFSDIDIDAFALLAASFSDMAQELTSFLNRGLGPMVTLLAENKELLGAAFGFIALVLLRKVIPAMGLFTRSIKQQSIDASSAHASYLAEIKSNSQVEKDATLAQIALERQKLREKLKGQTTARKAMDKSRGFGGEKLTGSTAQLKAATTEQQKITALVAKQSALNASMRTTTSAAIKEEQRALEDEILTRKAILQIKKEEKIVKQTEVAGASRWSHAELIRLKLLRAELIAFGHANIAATAETKGFWAGLKAVGIELTKVSGAAKFAGTNINIFGKALFLLKGYLVVVQVGLATLAMRLMGFFGWIMILLPVIVFLGKKLGLWSDAHDRLNTATEKANELSKDFAAKMKHNSEVLLDLTSALNKSQKAQLAQERSIRDTSAAIEEQAQALRNFRRDASQFAAWAEGVKWNWGMGAERELEENQDKFFRGIIESFETLSTAEQKIIKDSGQHAQEALDIIKIEKSKVAEQSEKIIALEKEYIKWAHKSATADMSRPSADETDWEWSVKINDIRDEAEERKKRLVTAQKEENRLQRLYLLNTYEQKEYFKSILGLREQINKETTKEAAGTQNMLSIQEGARDALRDYRDSFVVATDVDKPLAIFEQTMDNILINSKKMVTNQEARDKFLNKIKESESEILAMMTIENQLAYKGTQDGIDGETERLDLIRLTRNEYRRQQKTLIQNKQIFSEIAALQKMMSKLTKESTQFFQANLQLSEISLAMKRKEAETTFENYLSYIKVTEAQVIHAAGIENELALTEELSKLGINAQQLFSAETEMRKKNFAQLKEELHIATSKFKINQADAQLALKRLNNQIKLNNANLKTIELQRQMFSLLRRGTTTLTGPENIKQIVAGEKVRLETARQKAEIEKSIIRATYGILKAEAIILEKKAELMGITSISLSTIITDLENAEKVLVETIDKGLHNAALGFIVTLAKGFESLNLLEGLEQGPGMKRLSGQLSDIFGATETLKGIDKSRAEKLGDIEVEKGYIAEAKRMGQFSTYGIESRDNIRALRKELEKLDALEFKTKMDIITNAILNFAAAVIDLGPGGQTAAALAMFSANLLTTFTQIGEVFKEGNVSTRLEKIAAALAGVATVIAGMASVLSADSQAKIATIEQQIQMEKKLDGKSAQSMAKIKAMEVKKESIARKAFETNKKLQIGQAIINTAAGAAAALSVPYIGPFLAAMITVLGMAQVAIIKKTTYQGGGGSLDTVKMQQLDIGARSDRVDVTRGVTAGELSYLRGERGRGSGATNWVPGGGAVGLRQGYATGGGVLVGEQGPEIVRPTVPVTVNPNENMMGTTNVNFAIHAIDAAGLEDVLLRQRGNIIEMIREAANNTGERFLESVDTDVVGVG